MAKLSEFITEQEETLEQVNENIRINTIINTKRRDVLYRAKSFTYDTITDIKEELDASEDDDAYAKIVYGSISMVLGHLCDMIVNASDNNMKDRLLQIDGGSPFLVFSSGFRHLMQLVLEYLNKCSKLLGFQPPSSPINIHVSVNHFDYGVICYITDRELWVFEPNATHAGHVKIYNRMHIDNTIFYNLRSLLLSRDFSLKDATLSLSDLFVLSDIYEQAKTADCAFFNINPDNIPILYKVHEMACAVDNDLERFVKIREELMEALPIQTNKTKCEVKQTVDKYVEDLYTLVNNISNEEDEEKHDTKK